MFTNPSYIEGLKVAYDVQNIGPCIDYDKQLSRKAKIISHIIQPVVPPEPLTYR